MHRRGRNTHTHTHTHIHTHTRARLERNADKRRKLADSVLQAHNLCAWSGEEERKLPSATSKSRETEEGARVCWGEHEWTHLDGVHVKLLGGAKVGPDVIQHHRAAQSN